jgi:hypothetical protein
MSDPDRSEAHLYGYFGSREMADAFAADIEKMSGLQGIPIPRVEVMRCRRGGWNVWVWEE